MIIISPIRSQSVSHGYGILIALIYLEFYILNNGYPNNKSKSKSMLKKKCDTNIIYTIKLARQMIRLAQKGDEHREDPGCGVLYGILLDSGYRILDLAQKEKQNHMNKGWWNECIDP